MAQIKSILLILTVLCILGVTTKTIQTLTQRSTNQIILHDTNADRLSNTINSYYLKGYRVVGIAGQSYTPRFSNGYTIPTSIPEYRGDILVVMEK